MSAMSWLGRFAARWEYPEQRVWFVVAAWAVVLVVIAVVAAAGYAGVIRAHTVVLLAPERTVTWSGTSLDGVLLSNGTVAVHLRLTVTNPSERVLAVSSIAYKSWIEDLPAEAGLPNLGRSDNVLVNLTGTYLFFMAFLGSFDVTPVTVPAHGTATVAFTFNLTRLSDAARFQAVQNITAYASSALGDGTRAPWLHWVSVTLVFRDLPPPSATTSGYLTDLTRIVLTEGPNLG